MKKAIALTTCLLSLCSSTYATTYKGIDISHWQGDNIDFTEVKDDGIDVVYIKVAQGSDYEDPAWKTNYSGASDAGLSVGFYHYVTATSTDEAATQAKYFYDLIKDTTYEGYPVMDFESFSDLTDDEINEIATTYLTTLSELVGTTVAIYSDSSNADTLWDASLNVYPLWVAAYSQSDPDIGNWSDWAGFQYSDTGTVNGIDSSDIDLNYFKDTMFISTTSTDSSTNTSTDSSTSTNTSTDGTYTVVSGDSLWKIAQTYDTTVSELATLNNITDTSLIYPGEILKVPSTTNDYTSYTVVSGDTLWDIAQTYDTTVSELVSLNDISNKDEIYPGEVLKIPS